MNGSLNEKQNEAATTLSGPLLILAGAGAGKTKTIVERVVNIVKSGVAPYNILCVTFTNKAASEMRERVIHRLVEEKIIESVDAGRDSFNQPLVKTFHSLGLYILRRDGEALGLKKSFTILDTDDTKSIIKGYLNAHDIDTKMYEPAKIRNAISREKGDFKRVQDYRGKVANFHMDVTAGAWEAYEKSLKEQGAVDFDDLIVRTVELLRDHPSVRNKYINLFKYIHIDEYQDTNAAQYELCKLLVNHETQNICVVGDTDQNIYSWRGANLKNIMNFEKDYPKTKLITLEENYRSTQNILNLANASIKKNTVRKEKNLFTRAGTGELIEVMPAFDGESEAEKIAMTCNELIANGVNPSHIAVLYRTNFQSRALEEKMLNNGVPYTVLGTKFFERKEIKDILSYLKAAFNNTSQPDLKRVFETPKKGIGKTTILKLFANEPLPAAAQLKISKVFDFLNKIVSLSEEGAKLSEILTYILVESGLEKELKDDGEEGLDRLANINELITLAEKYNNEGELSNETFDDSLEKFLEMSSLSSDQDTLNKKDGEEPYGVRLMTVHASKGLEFDYVFIAGLEQDLFPSKNFGAKNRSKEEEEEERRLFYVAVTRARKKLYLSYAEMRVIFGERNIATPSEFLEDLDDTNSTFHDIYYKSGGGKVVYI
jgi:DNA helicase-2/ATP-dependent DNA helicase PcrA